MRKQLIIMVVLGLAAGAFLFSKFEKNSAEKKIQIFPSSVQKNALTKPAAGPLLISTSSPSHSAQAEVAAPPVRWAEGENQNAYSELIDLRKKGEAALPRLTEIVKSSIKVDLKAAANPHSFAAIQLRSEVALRITALEMIDELGATGANIQPSLTEILNSENHPTISQMAQISQMGVLQNRPGKLHRFLEKSLSDFEQAQ